MGDFIQKPVKAPELVRDTIINLSYPSKQGIKIDACAECGCVYVVEASI